MFDITACKCVDFGKILPIIERKFFRRSNFCNHKHNNLKLFTHTFDRFKVPDKAAGNLSSGLLHDLEIFNPNKQNC